MLSGLTFGSRRELEADSATKPGRKHKKHPKKHKKHKKSKSSKDARSSDSGSSDAEAAAVEADVNPAAPAAGAAEAAAADGGAPSHAAGEQRDAWMGDAFDLEQLGSSGRNKPSKTAGAATAGGSTKLQDEEPPIHAGLRHMDGTRPVAPAVAADEGALPTVGDGGASWRLKALKRAQQLAAEQGKDAATFISERWGSTAELTKALTSGGSAAHARAHVHEAMRRRQGDRPAGEGGPGPGSERGRPHYLQDIRSEAGQMRRPNVAAGGSSLSWRRPGGGAGRADSQDRGREPDPGSDRRHPNAHQQQQREEDLGGPGRKQGNRQQSRSRSRSRERRRGRSRSRSRSRERRHSPGSPRHLNGSHRQQQREHNPREYGRRTDTHGPGGGGRQQQGSGPPAGWREREADSSQGVPRGHIRQDEAKLLQQFAGTMNTFASDGSFLERMQQQQQQQGAGNIASPSSSREVSDAEDAEPTRPPAAPAAATAAAATAGKPAAGGGSSNQDRAAALRARLSGAAGQQQQQQGAADGAAAASAGGGNQSKAAMLRAKLMGKPVPPAATEPAAGGSQQAGRQVVALPLVDARGRAAPGAFGREGAGAAARALEQHVQGRAPKRVQRYGEGGDKERYYADDDAVDLQTLVKRAKHGDDLQDIDRALMVNIAAKRRFKEADLDADAEYDYDAGLDMAEARHKRGDAQKQAARQRQASINAHQRQEKAEDACTLCFNSSRRPRQLTIAIGQTTYLSLVQRGRLVPGHCCIAPGEHIASMRQVDDATWTEVRNFQKCLIQMFMAEGKEVLFMETAMNLGTGRQHACLEAIPVDADTLARAPMYFRKGLEEAESEWSQHAAKSVIDTKAKGLRGSIPQHFPYFYVQFGYANGFVHVIDNERKFDRNFGRQVLVGLLRLPAEDMHRRQRTDAPAVQEQQAREFRKDFAKYDWTKQLE